MGFEPITTELKVRYSTKWVTGAYEWSRWELNPRPTLLYKYPLRRLTYNSFFQVHHLFRFLYNRNFNQTLFNTFGIDRLIELPKVDSAHAAIRYSVYLAFNLVLMIKSSLWRDIYFATLSKPCLPHTALDGVEPTNTTVKV